MKNILKYASLLVAAVMLIACEGQSGGPTGSVGGNKLEITADKGFVQTFGGDFVTLTVTLGGQPVTEELMFFDANQDDKILDIKDGKFSTDKVGEYSIWVNHGTMNSEPVIIRAIDVEIPETPADPKPESTSFKTRVLLTEFTTTGCGFCPKMKSLLHNVFSDKTYEEKVVEVTCHSSLVNSVGDPAYVKTSYESFAAIDGMPYVLCDNYDGTIKWNWEISAVKSLLDKMIEVKGDGTGIAVNSVIKDNQLVAKVTIKASKTNQYRVGAMLLEDGIYGQQSSATETWMHTHNDVIRYIDASYRSNGNEYYHGHSVGSVEAGKTADFVFVWDLAKIWEDGNKYADMYGNSKWNAFVMENLHMAVFVSTIGTDYKGNERYYVNNVIDCRKLNGETKFEYR